MNWTLRYRFLSAIKSSLWAIPFAAGVLEFIVAEWIHRMDARIGWDGLGLGPEGAKAMTSTVVTLSLSFLVFTFGSLLVAIQVASGQYTPRIIATTLLRDNVIRGTVGLFVFSLLFAVKALDHTESKVPQLATLITAMLGLACIAAFLFLIDYSARLLRPVSLVNKVGVAGLQVLAKMYREENKVVDPSREPQHEVEPVVRTIAHDRPSAMVLALDVSRLVAEAGRAGCVIEFVPQVGDFVGLGEPLFHLHGRAADLRDDVLRGAVVFGTERTMEQDPLFAVRILVDIAIKALSKAINDPTTAVLAMDQLQRLLRSAGLRQMRSDYIGGSKGQLCVILHMPVWEDFVQLAMTEIRCYGAENVQIARRLRAMLVTLIETLPAGRHAALEHELRLLNRTIERAYPDADDRALASIPDHQGLGGSTGRRVTHQYR